MKNIKIIALVIVAVIVSAALIGIYYLNSPPGQNLAGEIVIVDD